MNWNKIETPADLQKIKDESKSKPVMLFKHSTTCSISRTVLDRLERNWKAEDEQGLSPYFLDLLRHRDLSNQIATDFSVHHESPQILIIENGKSVYDRSHFDIDYKSIKEASRSSVAG